MEGHIPELWAGIDAGKAHHHCVLIDEGNRLLSRKVSNDETALTELVADVLTLAAGWERRQPHPPMVVLPAIPGG